MTFNPGFNPPKPIFGTPMPGGLVPMAAPVSGPLTPKSHESHANIIRPLPLRSRFFPAENKLGMPDPFAPKALALQPWIEDDKENFFAKEKLESRCLHCFDKSAFILAPCTHTYSPLSSHELSLI
jgi:hypothetical protein